jgi:hypothetical protein
MRPDDSTNPDVRQFVAALERAMPDPEDRELYRSVAVSLAYIAGDPNKGKAYSDMTLRGKALALADRVPTVMAFFPKTFAPDFIRLLCDLDVRIDSGPLATVAFSAKSRDLWLRKLFLPTVEGLRLIPLHEEDFPLWWGTVFAGMDIPLPLREELLRQIQNPG